MTLRIAISDDIDNSSIDNLAIDLNGFTSVAGGHASRLYWR